MIAPRRIFPLAVLFYYLDASYGGLLRMVGPAKWPALGLLVMSGVSTRPQRPRAADAATSALLALFTVLAMASWFSGVEQGPFPLRLFGFLLLLYGMRHLAITWVLAGGWNEFESALWLLTRLVTIAAAIMLPLGISLGRSPDRFSAWFGNANTLGMILVLLAPVAFSRALRADRKVGGWPRIVFALVIILILSTGSRACLLGLLVGTAIYLWGTGRVRSTALVAICVLLAMASLAWPTVAPLLRDVPVFRRLIDEEGERITVYDEAGREWSATSGRALVRPLAVRLIGERPLLGYGWGAEEQVLAPYKDVLVIHEGANVHNSYLSLLLQSGWIGGLPLLLLVVLQILRGVLRVQRHPSSLRDPAAVLLSMSVVAVVHAAFESSLFSSGNCNALVTWLVIFAVGAMHLPQWREEPSAEPA